MLETDDSTFSSLPFALTDFRIPPAPSVHLHVRQAALSSPTDTSPSYLSLEPWLSSTMLYTQTPMDLGNFEKKSQLIILFLLKFAILLNN